MIRESQLVHQLPQSYTSADGEFSHVGHAAGMRRFHEFVQFEQLAVVDFPEPFLLLLAAD
jgi:hypothetical protein